MIEQWADIPGFSNYRINNFGQVFNVSWNRLMRTSLNNFGHVKISLIPDVGDKRVTRSVAVMVAEAFVPSPNYKCDHVIVLNGDFEDLRADNLAWRPRWYMWKYTHQLKREQPLYFQNLAVHNMTDHVYYNSIIDAGIAEGLLFEDIWRSTYSGAAIFPNSSVWEIVERV